MPENKTLGTPTPHQDCGDGACCHFMRPVMDRIHHNPGADIVRYARGRADVLSLASGESDEPTPAFICGAANKALGAGQTFYGPILGQHALRQEIAAYYQRVYGVALPLNRIIVTASGTTAIHLAMLSTVGKGDDVVTVFPLWKNLLGAIALQEATVRGVDLQPAPDGRGWALNLDTLFAAVTPRTRAIVLNSPNNPTGWVMPAAQMESVLAFARQRGLWVIADEVYGRLVYNAERAPSFLDVARPDDKIFIINSFSKNWAMTGWRLGWMIAPAMAEQRIYDLILYDNMGPPNFTQAGAIAALRDGEDFIRMQKERFHANAALVTRALTTLGTTLGGTEFIAPESGFYAFFKTAGEPDCMAFARRLIDDHALGLAPGCSFGMGFAGYMRLCFAVSEPKLRDALGRLEQGMRK